MKLVQIEKNIFSENPESYSLLNFKFNNEVWDIKLFNYGRIKANYRRKNRQ
jgi:hypothetical protein